MLMVVAAERVRAEALAHVSVDAVPVLLVGGVGVGHPGEVLRRQARELPGRGLGRGPEVGRDQQLQALDGGPDDVRALREPEHRADAQVLLRRVGVLADEDELRLYPAAFQGYGTDAEQVVLAAPDQPVPELVAGEQARDERVEERVPPYRSPGL